MACSAFQELAPDAAQRFLAAIAPELSPIILPPGSTLVQVADLPFYEEFKLYGLTDLRLPPGNVRYMLYRQGSVNWMDWTNEPIYRVNEIAPIKLAPETLVPYAKFFFHWVRAQLGRFIIVERPEDVRWLPEATDLEKTGAAGHLMPLTYQGIDQDGLFTLTGTVIFRNALFRTDIKVAPGEMDVIDPESEAPEHFSIGQMKLTDEELLIEDLHIPVDQMGL